MSACSKALALEVLPFDEESNIAHRADLQVPKRVGAKGELQPEFFERKKREWNERQSPAVGGEGYVPEIGSRANVVWPLAWSEKVRCLPNTLIRSSVFCGRDAGREGKREVFQNTRVRSPAGTEIWQSGDQLDYSDLKAFAAIVHLARSGRSRFVSLRMRELLQVQGLCDSGTNRRRTMERLLRLSKTTLKITVVHPRTNFSGPLLEHFKVSVNSKILQLVFAPRIDELFGINKYTLVDWEVWRLLKHKPMASWLYFFLRSHTVPHALKTVTILELCGSQAKSTYDFEKDLLRALNELKKALQSVHKHFSWVLANGKLSKVHIKSLA